MAESSQYEACLDTLYGMRRFGIKLELDTIRSMLADLDAPHQRFRAIHVAGTNGKGSIASTLSTILQRAGYRVGLYTSPHLVRFNERICIDNRPVSDDAVMQAYEAVRGTGKTPREPTFFEYTTVMAFHLFGAHDVEWAVIETGMGGRMDATNVVVPAVSVITNLSLEHQAYLGDTLEEIAFEKAGIIKPGVPAVTAVSQESALAVMQRTADEKGAPLHRYGRDFRTTTMPDGAFRYHGIHHEWEEMRTGLTGAFQIQNAALSLAVCDLLRQGGTDLPETAIRSGLADNRWPGRLEVISTRPLVILDGAHNLAAAQCLAEYIRTELSGRHLTLLLGVLDDKPFDRILACLVPLADRVVLTSPKTYRAVPARELYNAVRHLKEGIEVIPDIDSAVEAVLDRAAPGDAVCIAGSLYVVGDTKAFLEQRGYAAFKRSA